jgi:hypothetical protein
MGLPLGAVIVHEIGTRGGGTMKVAEPRRVGMAPRAPGTDVVIQPLSPEAVTVFRASATSTSLAGAVP